MGEIGGITSISWQIRRKRPPISTSVDAVAEPGRALKTRRAGGSLPPIPSG